jgi:hypothetical protein
MMPTVRFEAIRPKNLDVAELRLALVAGMNEISQDILREYKQTVSYWKRNKPTFSRKLETNVGGAKESIAITIYCDSDIYKYIDRGTSGRIVDGSQHPVVLSGTYSPGSMPGTLSVSPQGGVEGGGQRVLRGVFFWPGIRARLFTEQIADKMQKSTDFKMTEKMQSAVERARDKWWR